jgi:hypothetical protein
MRTHGPVGDGKLSWPINNVSSARTTFGDCLGICRGGEASMARANGALHIYISGNSNPQSGDFNAVKMRRRQCLSLALSPSLSRSFARARALSLYIPTYIHKHTCFYS